MFKKIKWFFQKILRGYSTLELWNLDYTFSKFILKRLKAFQKMKRYGHPSDLKSMEEWNSIIDKMIFSFEYAQFDYGMDEDYLGHNRIWEPIQEKQEVFKINNKPVYVNWRYNKDIHDIDHKKYQEGIELFSKYFSNLWD